MTDLCYGVYFIYCGDRNNAPVKIGVTSDIENRISALQQATHTSCFVKHLSLVIIKTKPIDLKAFFIVNLEKTEWSANGSSFIILI